LPLLQATEAMQKWRRTFAMAIGRIEMPTTTPAAR